MLTPLAAAALAFLAPQSIERQVTQAHSETATTTVAPGAGHSFSSPGVNIDTTLPFNLPDDEGVTYSSCFLTTTIWAEASIGTEALDPTGTRYSGSFDLGLASCSSGCTWGASDWWGSSSSFGTPTNVHSQGELLIFAPTLCSEAAPCVFNYSIDSSSTEWASVLSDPSARGMATLRDITLQAYDVANNPTGYRLRSFDVNASVEIEATHTFELSAAPLTEYCTSPAGSTGAPATLAAYGSQQEGTEFLTVRAVGLPMGSFALLFVGTAPAQQPMGSTTLCVGGSVARMGGVVQATTTTADFNIDLKGRTPGSRVYLQAFFRDPQFGVAATNASAFVVRPRI